MALVELSGPDAAAYISRREDVAPHQVHLSELGGGVSNHVLLVETPVRRYIVKQALARLRVEQEWLSRRDRIWREAEAIRLLKPMLPPGALPDVLYEDRENYLFAMTIAPGKDTWKSLLLRGETRLEVAEQAARIHRGLLACPLSDAQQASFSDLEVFDQLRLDPYYRFTATRHRDLAVHFEAGIERCRRNRIALVHGDWSPKNLMVDRNLVTAIDFEVIHLGDPAFDCAFLLNHLVLKCFHQPRFERAYQALANAYWRTLSPHAEIAEATLMHLPLLMLARVDGKSPVEYIREEEKRESIRQFARDLIACRPGGIEEVYERLSRRGWGER
jgi:5-methylthioribose kinase